MRFNMKQNFNAGVSYGFTGDLGLTAEQKAHLLKHLIKSKLTEIEKQEFLKAVSTELECFKESKLLKDKNIKSMTNLKEFSFAINRLELAIEKLNEDNQDAFKIYSYYFHECTDTAKPPVSISDEMRDIKPPLAGVLEGIHTTLARLRKTLPDLEKVADYSIRQLEDNLSNGLRISDEDAKRLALAITKIYRDLFNKLPPYTRSTWFDAFMGELAKIIDPKIKLGARTLKYAHESLNN